MIVCDTHAWIWWVSADRRLSTPARRALDASNDVVVAAISLWEVAMLVRKGTLVLDRDVNTWLQDALAVPRVRLQELNPEIAVESSRLQWSHRDPADRMIVATGIVLRAPIATKDERIATFRSISTIW